MKCAHFFVVFICDLNNRKSMLNIHQFHIINNFIVLCLCYVCQNPIPHLLFALRLQLERDVDFPSIALGDLIDVTDRDVVLLEPELDGVADDV